MRICLMRKEDADGVVELYRTVYGDKYPVKSVYDPEALIAAQECGDCYRIVAVDDGRVVGHFASYRSSPPNPGLYEDGQGLVLTEYRNRNILEEAWRYCHDVFHPEKGITQRWGEGVCNHVFTQKACLKLGYVFTGLEIDLMPAATYQKEKSSAGRVSSILGFKITDAASRRVHVPAVYERTIAWLLEPLALRREFICDIGPFPSDRQTAVSQQIYAEAGVARFTFMTLGHDFEVCLASSEGRAVSEGCTVAQAFLNLAEPAAVGALSILRGRGYFLGGVLPCWYGDDGLLMQKIFHKPNMEGIQLADERGRRILDLILEDRASVGLPGND